MTAERKFPWRLGVLATVFIALGVFAIYSQIVLIRAGEHRLRIDALFLAIGVGLLLRWSFSRTLAQLALVLACGASLVALIGIPLGFTHVEYVADIGPGWLQLLVIVVLSFLTSALVYWLFRITMRSDVRSWFHSRHDHAA